MITINIEKAKEIVKQNLRKDRQPILEKLDIDLMKAIETNDVLSQQKIIEKKQLLRDITTHELIEKAETVQDLKSIAIEKLIKL